MVRSVFLGISQIEMDKVSDVTADQYLFQIRLSESRNRHFYFYFFYSFYFLQKSKCIAEGEIHLTLFLLSPPLRKNGYFWNLAKIRAVFFT